MLFSCCPCVYVFCLFYFACDLINIGLRVVELNYYYYYYHYYHYYHHYL
jgi:hypothetical protein